MRVLIVDDNRDVRAMLKALLELDGHEIVEAVNGPQAVRIAGESLPDVSLIDLGLPGFDGLEVARRLRGDARLRHTYMVAVTGYGQADDQKRSAESGFDAHLVKPVSRERLSQILIEASRQIVAHRTGEPTPASDDGESLDDATASSDATPSSVATPSSAATRESETQEEGPLPQPASVSQPMV